ncbi:pseudouridine synthase [Betaproteobacteria bacterium]|nr:pseudouridine synthase [Betaproteobacteria bacterium]GHU21769.1 pseudouridine synthase [Betaproteobacteria bacterium]GHU27656.1 pseudouridine synthase [Betaproteobacteria bacterium]
MNELADYSPDEAPDFEDEDVSGADVEFATIPVACAGLRLDQALARVLPRHSRSRLQGWLKEGLIRVNGASPEARSKVWGGEQLEIHPVPTGAELAPQAEEIDFPVVFEDDTVLVINKPAGLVVHPGNGNWSGTLMNALLHHAPGLSAVPRAGIVHRLDKDTSGLMVVAKTLAAQTALVRQLQARTVRRHYLALVHGVLALDGEISAPIGRHPVQRTKMAVVANGREALTRYMLRELLGAATLVECRLATGRTHQIRVHMTHLGHPLVGDPVYGLSRVGDARLAGFSRQALHAYRLGLVHPASGETMTWTAPLPDDLAGLLATLGSRAAEALETWGPS